MVKYLVLEIIFDFRCKFSVYVKKKMQISANSFLPKYSHEALTYSFDLLSLYRTKNN